MAHPKISQVNFSFYTLPFCSREHQKEEGYGTVASGLSLSWMVSQGSCSYSNTSASLHFWRENQVPHGDTSMKAALELPCLLALHICQPHPSPRPRLMNETCSPSDRSPEAISQLLSVDLFTPSGLQTPSFACAPTCSEISKLLQFSFPDPGPIHLPKWVVVPVNLCRPEQKLVLRIAPVMGKGSSHVKCDSQWQACLGPQGSQRRPSPCCPAVSHIRNPVTSLENYVAPVQLKATTEGSLLEGGLPRQGMKEHRTQTHRPSSHLAHIS